MTDKHQASDARLTQPEGSQATGSAEKSSSSSSSSPLGDAAGPEILRALRELSEEIGPQLGRDAAQLIETLTAENDALRARLAHLEGERAFKCQAQNTADPPQDCDWPFCGCDPYAQKVLDATDQLVCRNCELLTAERDALQVRLDAAEQERDMACKAAAEWRTRLAEKIAAEREKL
jgi:hypothetical protein